MSTTLKTSASPDAWGEVHAHERVVRYRHSGAGPAVLLLGVTLSPSGDLWPELPALLQSRFRVVIPQLPESIDDVARSLECLLEGVGASGIGLIAGGPYAYPAVELAMGRSDFVSRLVLVGEGDVEDSRPTESATTTALRVPVLVLSRRLSVSKAVDLAVPFLRGILGR